MNQTKNMNNKHFFYSLIMILSIVRMSLSIYFEPYMNPNNRCYPLEGKETCNKTKGCAWCSDNGWDGIYRCYEIEDDNDCITKVATDCVKATRCYYCIYHLYASQTCYKSLYSKKKLYGIE